MNKGGRGRALLLAESAPGEPCRIVCFLYNHERNPQDAETLLRTAGAYAALYGVEQMECEYLSGEGQEVFQRCGWSEPVTEQVIYRVPVQHLERVCVDRGAFEGTIVTCNRISPEVWLQFLRERDDDRWNDRRSNIYVSDPKRSFGALADGRLVGCMFGRENGKQLEVDLLYRSQEHSCLLQVFLTRMLGSIQKSGGTIREVQINAYDQEEAKTLQSLLEQVPHRREVWLKSSVATEPYR